MHVDSLWEGVDLSLQVSRARFEGILSPILPEIFNPIRELLKNNNIDFASIDKVILTGGTCKIPRIQGSISDMFENAEVLRKIPQDEIMAVGAAKEASLHLKNR